MDPQYEQRLRDEVIYLHSLWHQGPPRPAAAVAAAPSASTSTIRHNLQPVKATAFKKEKKLKGKKGKKSNSNPNDAVPETNPPPRIEWPIPSPPPPRSTTGWPSPKPKSEAKPPSLSPEEQLKLASKHAHQNAIKAVHEFFKSNDSDDSNSIDSNSDEGDELMEEDDGREEYSFFFNVFKEDDLLREYYEKNFAKGEFSCLVCGALGGKRMGKRFNGCLPLVQHSISIAKTKKRRAHRAFGQAVCKVLGWDIDHLSAIVSMLSDKPDVKPGNLDNENKESSITIADNVDSVEGNIGKLVPEDGSNGTGILLDSNEGDMGNLDNENKESSITIASNVEPVEGSNENLVREGGSIGIEILLNSNEGNTNFSACPDAKKTMEDLSMAVQEPAAESLASNSLTFPGTDKNLEDLSVVHPHIEEPPTEDLASNSSMLPDSVKNVEDFSMMPPHNLEPLSDGRTTVPLDVYNSDEIEIPGLQSNIAAPDGQKADNEAEN